MTIYIIEDNYHARENYITWLEQNTSLKVIGSSDSGTIALKEILILRPHILLTDININGPLQGEELIQQIKLIQPELIIIIISVFEPYFKALGDYFIDKPLRFEILKTLIEKIERRFYHDRNFK
jgi:YesN/AraC family two-component response regulator